MEVGSFRIFFLGLTVTVVATVFVAATVRDDEGVQEKYERQWYCSKCGRKFHERGSEETASFVTTDNETGKALVSRHPDYAERVVRPIQIARTQTERDAQGLHDIQKRSTEDGTFDPMAPTPLDKGLVSRLASLGLVSWNEKTDTFNVSVHPTSIDTDDGLSGAEVN
jgi:hypothetical protein